jgi:integrase
MGANTTQIERQIAETRDDIESTIIQLRERSRNAVRRGAVFALAAVAVGAAVGAGFVAWRLTRPPTMRERVNRVIPLDLNWIDELRRRLDLSRRLPPIRLYVGDRAVGESPPETTVERLVVRAAQAAGTAAAAAIVSRLVSRMRSGRAE